MKLNQVVKAVQPAKVVEKALAPNQIADNVAQAIEKTVKASADNLELSNTVAKTSAELWDSVSGLVKKGTKTDPTPLFDALYPKVPLSNGSAAVDKLLQAKFDVNGADRLGQTALHKLAFDGKAADAQKLIAAGADVAIADAKGRTPLFWAAARGDADTVKVLLEAGANPNIPDKLGNGILDVAKARGHQDVAALLEAAGAKPVGPLKDIKPFTGVLDGNHPMLKLFNDELDMHRDLATLESIPVTFNANYNSRLNQAFDKIFMDEGLKAGDNKLIWTWTSFKTITPGPKLINSAFSDVMKGGSADMGLQKTVGDMLATRQERWQRLSELTGIPVPDAFHVYRGTRGDQMVESVVNAWRDDASKTMQIPHRELASWSLNKETADYFAYNFAGDASSSAVVFEKDVPFAATFADKWADGGNFIKTFSDQDEVLVGLKERNALAIDKSDVTVLYNGRKYSYADREDLFKAWDNRQRAPIDYLIEGVKSLWGKK
ncbi:MAG TPA: ankyrin repeat domain-containing protein [Stenomitos sp.]